MGNERSFMQLRGVVGELIIVPFGSEVMAKWFGWGEKRVEAVLWIL